MKKLMFLSGLFLTLFLLSASTPVEAANTKSKTAKTVTKIEVIAPNEASPGATGDKAQINYALPYPGILVDHPLFFLKGLRDRIIESMIMEPNKKIEFSLLQADKYFGMGTFYLDQNKGELAKKVFTSSNMFSEKAVKQYMDLKSNGVTVPEELAGKVSNSILKRREVITDMQPAVRPDQKDIVKMMLDTLDKQHQNFSKSK